MRLLGIDFGMRFLGLALAEGDVASPLTSIDSRNWESAAFELIKIIVGSDVEKIIIGYPLSSDGAINPQSTLTQKFAQFLKRRSSLPICLFPESYSSQEALARSIDLDTPAHARRHLDSMAATIILERYLLKSEDAILV
ncbi:MAG: Holliday junction resolvase RuvX [candidate division WWE3 bacterium]|nr:Holliday junction resolvase RuvX [candidate division WWE3 bacterium]